MMYSRSLMAMLYVNCLCVCRFVISSHYNILTTRILLVQQKTILALMINFMYGTPAFIARLLPIFSLKSDVLMERLTLLLEIIHDAGGFVFLGYDRIFR